MKGKYSKLNTAEVKTFVLLIIMSKKLLISFLALNSCIIVLGILMFVFSCVILANLEEFSSAVKVVYKVAPIILLIIGITIATMAIIGIFASIDRNNKYLCGYIGALIGAMVVELVAGSLQLYSVSNMNVMFQNTYITIEDPSLYLNDLQKKKECCGYKSYADYHEGSAEGQFKLPSSCCPDSPDTCIADSSGASGNETDHYDEGCRDHIMHYHETLSSISAGVCIAAIIISVVLIILIDKMGRIPATVKRKSSVKPEKQKKIDKKEKKLNKHKKDEEEIYI